jgi:hypothetical protein
MRLPRFRIRTLMIAVALVALLVWGAMMGIRSYVYYRLASYYETQERLSRYIFERDRENPAEARSVGVVWGSRIADFYAPLAQKYRRAMWRPWESVAPDPPAPVFGSP